MTKDEAKRAREAREEAADREAYGFVGRVIRLAMADGTRLKGRALDKVEAIACAMERAAGGGT